MINLKSDTVTALLAPTNSCMLWGKTNLEIKKAETRTDGEHLREEESVHWEDRQDN